MHVSGFFAAAAHVPHRPEAPLEAPHPPLVVEERRGRPLFRELPLPREQLGGVRCQVHRQFLVGRKVVHHHFGHLQGAGEARPHQRRPVVPPHCHEGHPRPEHVAAGRVPVVDEGVQAQVRQAHPLQVLDLGTAVAPEDQAPGIEVGLSSLLLKPQRRSLWVLMEPEDAVRDAVHDAQPHGEELRRDPAQPAEVAEDEAAPRQLVLGASVGAAGIVHLRVERAARICLVAEGHLQNPLRVVLTVLRRAHSAVRHDVIDEVCPHGPWIPQVHELQWRWAQGADAVPLMCCVAVEVDEDMDPIRGDDLRALLVRTARREGPEVLDPLLQRLVVGRIVALCYRVEEDLELVRVVREQRALKQIGCGVVDKVGADVADAQPRYVLGDSIVFPQVEFRLAISSGVPD